MYKLVLTKKPKDADITLGAGPGGAIAGQIIEVPKDVSVTHPYTHSRAAAELQKRLGAAAVFTRYDLQAVIHVEKVKKARAHQDPVGVLQAVESPLSVTALLADRSNR